MTPPFFVKLKNYLRNGAVFLRYGSFQIPCDVFRVPQIAVFTRSGKIILRSVIEAYLQADVGESDSDDDKWNLKLSVRYSI